MTIYLDNAATTPVHPKVIEEMAGIMKECYGNPSSIHALGRKSRTIIEEARKKIAAYLNCAPGEIFFTSGGTEADNMAIRQSVANLGVKNIITSAIEHHAVLHTIEDLHHKGLVNMHLVNLLPNGHIDLNHLEHLLGLNQNVMVSLMHANNEIGNLLDIKKVGELCLQHKALFHCDTVQTVGHYAIDLKTVNISFLACAAHKFNGPKGIGFIYINHSTKLAPFITGGAQERNMRGGTENLYGIAGLSMAMQLAYENLHEHQKHIQGLKTYMIEQLKLKIPGVTFNGDAEGNSLYTVLNVRLPETKIAEMLLFKLDIAGICASGGSACSSGSDKGSHVLAALGVEPNKPNIRFSFGNQNTKEEINTVVDALSSFYQTANA